MSVTLAAVSCSLPAQNNQGFYWTVLRLPAIEKSSARLGVAGVFAGMDSDICIIAGGANFPDQMPWEGGVKKRYDDVYLLQKKSGRWRWVNEYSKKLPEALAYGIAVSTSKGLFCSGGEKEDGTLSNKSFFLHWLPSAGELSVTALTPMPLPLANAAAVSYRSGIYIMGGETEKKVSDRFFMTDITGDKIVWKELPPVPIPLSHALAVVQKNEKGQDCIYLIGGRRATASGISDLHGTVFCYEFTGNRWITLDPLRINGRTISLSAATGVAAGNNEILVFGGDRGETFHEIESLNAMIAAETNQAAKEKLLLQKKKLLTGHVGFNKEILIYNTHSRQWKQYGILPFAAQVTTNAVVSGKQVLIPCGEIKPGVRTPLVHITTIH